MQIIKKPLMLLQNQQQQLTKTNNMDFKNKLISTVVMLMVTFSLLCCQNNKNDKVSKTIMKLNYYSKQIENPSIVIIDSLMFRFLEIKYNKSNRSIVRERKFKFIGSSYFEEKLLVKDLLKYSVDTLYLLAFSLKDTVFLFRNDASYLPVGLDDWKYRISKQNGVYYFSKMLTKDSTFKDEYIYDKDFNLLNVNILEGKDTLMFAK